MDQDKSMLLYIEQELLRLQALHGFHFMDDLIDKIVEYNKEQE